MDDKELWLRARAGLPEMEAPDGDDAALLIAGYLDGALGEAEQASIEAWLAGDPAALDLMLASRADLAESEVSATAVPKSLIERAQGIVRERPVASEPAGAGAGSWLRRLFGAGILQPVGVAAALLLAVLAGAELAQSSFTNLMVAEAVQTDGDLGLGGDDLF